MRFILLSWLLLAGSLLSFGQDLAYREKYRQLVQQDKRKEATAVVAQWEKAKPQDPDVYVAKFNLLLHAAERPADTATPSGSRVQSTGQGITVGDAVTDYDPGQVNQAIQVLRQGMALAPNRLDIRFGMAKAAEYIGDARQQYQVLSEALAWRQSAAGQPWRWQDGQPLPAPEAQFVPESLEEYARPYWGGESAEGYQHGLALTELLLKYYPQNSLGYFNKALYYALTKDEKQAFAQFVQADKRQPNDPQTLANLVRLSLNLKNKAAASSYLARLRKYPDYQEDYHHYTEELNKL